jgi:hypothetical protein
MRPWRAFFWQSCCPSELDADGIAVSRDLLNVHFVFGPTPDAVPRIRCWSETVIFVTS